ncbi:MAG: rhodanese-like domain-containing protein [Cyclobacteriaceae bacterium]
MNTEQIIKERKGTIVDVRSVGEYKSGHVEGSINIPLQDIPQKIQEIKNLKSPLVLCCASGNRSGQAYQYLSQQGIVCVNGGSWFDVEYFQSQNV